MESAIQNVNYHLGLLHFVHLLVTVDGVIDEREARAISRLQHEENMPDAVFQNFQRSLVGKAEREIYEEGIACMNHCNDVEKLCAFVHLYKLAQADDAVHVKEVRFLLYSLKATRVSFEDVEYAVKVSKEKAIEVLHKKVA